MIAGFKRAISKSRMQMLRLHKCLFVRAGSLAPNYDKPFVRLPHFP